ELKVGNHGLIAKLISAAEAREAGGNGTHTELFTALDSRLRTLDSGLRTPVIGMTGTGGAGKSSLTDELLLRFTKDFPDKHVAVLAVDPSKRKTGGALLGDRIRMNSLGCGRIYMRSLATRESGSEVSKALDEAIGIVKAAGFDLIIVETSGIGQGSSAIVDMVDIPAYVMTREYGAATQLEKIDMLDFAKLVALNKFERPGSADALRDVKKQMWRNRGAKQSEKPEDMPAFPTIASQFNDPGVNAFYQALLAEISTISGKSYKTTHFTAIPKDGVPRKAGVIPAARVRYLSEISDSVRTYHKWVGEQQALASSLYSTWRVLADLGDEPPCRVEPYAKDKLDAGKDATIKALRKRYNEVRAELAPECIKLMAECPELIESYTADENVYTVRGKDIRVANYTESLSHTKIPKVALPKFSDWGDWLAWQLRENVPGRFPFTAGTFPYKRQGEEPARMFAGEGPPYQTNRRFHLLAAGQPAARLSTAFDSVTLYGEDPHERPDIWGKVGESGVSICTVEDAEILYSGFDLCDPKTSVSMTINGPAPIILAFFMNAAIRQQVRKHLMEAGKLSAEYGVRSTESKVSSDKRKDSPTPHPAPRTPHSLIKGQTQKIGVEAKAAHAETGKEWWDPRNFSQSWEEIRALIDDAMYTKIAAQTLSTVRGTVQADILKEDQAQNTCIFSTEFALKMMGDVQEFFTKNDVKNYYSVSISGYHIAEAGANPVSQLAFTLANGFTYVEAYLARGMKVNDFAPNLSFFFSNGLDPEYSVIGRVARRIWAVAMKRLYGANERSQMLKYHIQTSGRSLHAMEIDFNDIRTTLQALMAIYDNCNSLHTNAFDEAITTPTEGSVRRALAIQLIINRELGMAKNENPLQGAFIIDQLTDLVEEAVLTEFDRITERGGVLGSMETQYQRGKIQEESMYYERLKHNGELPVIGVNTFLNPNAEKEWQREVELRRATKEQKNEQIERLRTFQERRSEQTQSALKRLQQVALEGGNIFAELMTTVQHASLGQISGALYEVGGRYRRNM
ncbi:MAG: methylmalonyl-CoA mutase, partial [Planctomycetaceae bacterium]|nr:methylmalonyl-CoA mutase [Planctomycetaceae bacterium]